MKHFYFKLMKNLQLEQLASEAWLDYIYYSIPSAIVLSLH